MNLDDQSSACANLIAGTTCYKCGEIQSHEAKLVGDDVMLTREGGAVLTEGRERTHSVVAAITKI